jgi:hypothetical protein
MHTSRIETTPVNNSIIAMAATAPVLKLLRLPAGIVLLASASAGALLDINSVVVLKLLLGTLPGVVPRPVEEADT